MTIRLEESLGKKVEDCIPEEYYFEIKSNFISSLNESFKSDYFNTNEKIQVVDTGYLSGTFNSFIYK